MRATAREFVEQLTGSGILTARQARALDERLRQLSHSPSVRELGSQLVQHGVATKFQVEEILAGRGRSLRIGKYLLLDKLRAGPMGVVYRALQTDLDREVAVKVLPPGFIDSPDTLVRFRRETRMLAQLQHPRIVVVHDANLDSKPPYLVMEYVSGLNLSEYVQRNGPLPLAHAATIIAEAAEALEAAHASKIVHRDVKPSNLMMTRDGHAKLLDFGLVRRIDVSVAEDGDLTSGYTVGTLDYMAPEQIVASSKVDERADIYGLACTFYYLLAGRPPTPDGPAPAKTWWHQQGPIPNLREICPHAPDALQAIFAKMIARQPDARYRTCGALLSDLRPVVQDLTMAGGETIPIGVLIPDEPTPMAHKDTAIPWQFQIDTRQATVKESKAAPAPRRSRQRPLWMMLAICSGLAAVALSVVVGLNLPSRPEPANVAKQPARKKAATRVPLPDKAALDDIPTPFPLGTATTTSEWNPAVTDVLDRVMKHGAQRGVGKLLYSEIDTAIEQRCDGEWQIGGMLTASGRPVALRLQSGKLFSAFMTPSEAIENEVEPTTVGREIDADFTERYQPLVTIADATLRQKTAADGTITITANLKLEPLSQPSFDTMQIVLEHLGEEGSDVSMATLSRFPRWATIPEGWETVEFEHDRPIDTKFTARVFLRAFLYEPKPSMYRISNEREIDWSASP